MAVAEDKKTSDEMIKAWKPASASCGTRFYAGYTDREQEGVWTDVNSKENLSFVEWDTGQPNNAGGVQHCMDYDVEKMKNDDVECSSELCPICRVPELANFHLQGVCQNSFIDRFYVLQSEKELLGYMRNKIVWSEQNNRKLFWNS